MALELKQKFGTETAISVTGFSTLANADTVTSDIVDNSTTLFDEIVLEIKVGGTAISTSWCDVRIAASIDGGTDFDSWKTPYAILPTLDMSTDNPIYHARFVAPQKWKLMVMNNTGAALDIGSASYQGVTYSTI